MCLDFQNVFWVDKMAKKVKDVRSWAVKEGFSEKTADAIYNFHKFVETGKYPNKKEFMRWKRFGFIKKDKDGRYKAVLDDDMAKGNGLAWIMAGLTYEGIVKRV